MTIYNLGSINIDHVYRVPHLPQPGETLSSSDYTTGLGGKGANQSIAIVKAGGNVVHVGAIGSDGDWVRKEIAKTGVNVEHILTAETPTGHGIINVDDDGENAIVLFNGANHAISEDQVSTALSSVQSGDWLVLQNETNLAEFATRFAREKGAKIAYAAAPFDARKTIEMLPLCDLVAVNEIEAKQLSDALGEGVDTLPVNEVLVTRGSEGASLYSKKNDVIEVKAFNVDPVDTTGAGDTFFGYFVASRDLGKDARQALTIASAASAIQVTRRGAADAIPSLEEVEIFLRKNM